jgi:hypothetical protein
VKNDNKNFKPNKKQITTRQEIIMKKIDEARRSVIDSELELAFLEDLKRKVDKGELTVSNIYTGGPADLDKQINLTAEFYDYNRAKLDFYKQVREDSIQKMMIKDAEKTMEAVPHTINYSDIVKNSIK